MQCSSYRKDALRHSVIVSQRRLAQLQAAVEAVKAGMHIEDPKETGDGCGIEKGPVMSEAAPPAGASEDFEGEAGSRSRQLQQQVRMGRWRPVRGSTNE